MLNQKFFRRIFTMKRALALLLVLTMVMCALAACGGNGGTKTTAPKATTTNTTNTTGTSATTTPEPVVPTEVPPVVWFDFEENNYDDDDFVIKNAVGGDIVADIMAEIEFVDGANGGKAVHFPTTEGDINYLQVANNDALNFKKTDEFTIEFYYKLDADATGFASIFQKGDKTAESGWYGVWVGDSDASGVCWGGHAGNQKIGELSSKDKWHHIMVIQKDGIGYTYLDGVAISAFKAVDMTSATDLFFGGVAFDTADNAQFKGSIDEFKIYDYAKDTVRVGTPVAAQGDKLPTEEANKGPVLHLDFEKNNWTGSTIKNAAGTGLDATVMGTVGTIAGPNSNGAAYFTASETANYLKIADNEKLNFKATDEFSIDFWYMLDFDAAGWDTIFAKGSSNNGWYGMWLGTKDSATEGVCWGGDTGNKQVGSVNSKYKWHHITVIQADGMISAYIDGEFARTFPAKDYTSATDLLIGGDGVMKLLKDEEGNDIAGSEYHAAQFQGAIDDFKVYDYALTEKFDKNPVLELDFEDLTNMTGATVVGNVTAVDGVDGGKAAYFGTGVESNGKTGINYIKVANSDALNFTVEDEFTIDFWYKLDETPTGWQNIFSKGSSGNGWYGVWASNSNYTTSGVCWGGDTGNRRIVSNAKVGEWVRITITQKDGKITAFANGKIVWDGSAAWCSPFDARNYTSTSDLFIGANSSDNAGSGQFKGAIDNFKVYNYAFE